MWLNVVSGAFVGWGAYFRSAEDNLEGNPGIAFFAGLLPAIVDIALGGAHEFPDRFEFGTRSAQEHEPFAQQPTPLYSLTAAFCGEMCSTLISLAASGVRAPSSGSATRRAWPRRVVRPGEPLCPTPARHRGVEPDRAPGRGRCRNGRGPRCRRCRLTPLRYGRGPSFDRDTDVRPHVQTVNSGRQEGNLGGGRHGGRLSNGIDPLAVCGVPAMTGEIMSPAELAARLGHELSRVGGGRQRVDGLRRYAAALDWSAMARASLAVGVLLYARRRPDGELFGPGGAEYAELLRTGAVRPVPPDRRDPRSPFAAAANACEAVAVSARARRGPGRCRCDIGHPAALRGRVATGCGPRHRPGNEHRSQAPRPELE